MKSLAYSCSVCFELFWNSLISRWLSFGENSLSLHETSTGTVCFANVSSIYKKLVKKHLRELPSNFSSIIEAILFGY